MLCCIPVQGSFLNGPLAVLLRRIRRDAEFERTNFEGLQVECQDVAGRGDGGAGILDKVGLMRIRYGEMELHAHAAHGLSAGFIHPQDRRPVPSRLECGRHHIVRRDIQQPPTFRQYALVRRFRPDDQRIIEFQASPPDAAARQSPVCGSNGVIQAYIFGRCPSPVSDPTPGS